MLIARDGLNRRTPLGVRCHVRDHNVGLWKSSFSPILLSINFVARACKECEESSNMALLKECGEPNLTHAINMALRRSGEPKPFRLLYELMRK